MKEWTFGIVLMVISCASAAQQVSTETPQSKARKMLAGLTLERKVAQLVCAGIRGDVPSGDPRMQQWIDLVKDHGVGGLVISGGTAEGAATLINKLQDVAAIPVLISADFEGGAGQQFKGATEFPPNMAFAATRNEDLMYQAAQIMAKEGRAIGIHLTYTPVVDMTLSPTNPQESGRSFGGDLALLNTQVKAYVAGYHKEGMLVTAKHFPGRGDIRGGPSHPSFTTLNKDAKQLDEQEFKAFSHAVAAGVDFVMTEHIAVPSITGDASPASIAPKLVNVIRERLKFKGLITTGDLWYDHVVDRFGRDEVAVLAIEAGHDIVLRPKDPVAAVQAIVTAVKSGRLAPSRIDSSVYKLLVKKYELGLFERKRADVKMLAQVAGTTGHLKLAQDVADRSLTLMRNDNVLPLKEVDPSKVVHITVQKTPDQSGVGDIKALMEKNFKGIQQFSIAPEQDKRIYSDILRAAGAADLVLVSLFVQRDRHGDAAPLPKEIAGVLDGMAGSVPGKVVVMSFGNPYLITKLPKARCFVAGYGEGGSYGNQYVYFNSFIRLIEGEITPTGKLPVEVSPELPAGFGLQITK